MARLDRCQQILKTVKRKGFVSADTLRTRLEISPATLKRDLEYLRSQLHCPLEWDRERRGYVLQKDPNNGGEAFELPGLWFNASEIYALLTMQHLLKGVQPGLLDAHIAPLQARLRELMGKSPHTAAAIERRVKLIHMGTRRVEAAHFERIAKAVLDRQRLRIAYLNRDRQEVTEREVSPLQLVYYRENWLLDAWCHTREAIRSFSLDAIQRAATVDNPAIEVAQATMSKHFEGGYGIFAGPPKHRAKLKFTKSRAQYVALERWHPQQSSKYLRDGSYVLEVPYSNDQELLMDLLRHGTEVEVLGPPALRRKLANTLQEAAAKYLSPAV